eukprot:scaffold19441_cov129-Isochrysis_galbana.AAC.6
MAQALLLLGVAAAAAATIEPRTGISFPEKHKGGSLAKVRLPARPPARALSASASELLGCRDTSDREPSHSSWVCGTRARSKCMLSVSTTLARSCSRCPTASAPRRW